MDDSCERLHKQVQEHYGFLFARGFKVIHAETSSHGRCLLILESDGFRIKIYGAWDEVNVLLGFRDAPVIWSEKAEGSTHWYYLRSIAGYLKNTKIQPGDNLWDHDSKEEQLKKQAKMLKKHYSQIERLFARREFSDEMADYEAYVSDVRRRIRERIEEIASQGSKRKDDR